MRREWVEMEEERRGREVDGERKRKVESWGREEGERNIQREGKERKGKKWIKVKKRVLGE